ncbi:hypothetical protein G5V57_03385 [Nordella sp. HKS 07]|uniref:hypothetical protein n=1 Tax=Nordella sp. HKS 07 TaxID=2712222 RepID=UPI0013E187FE|nr:hypothetical protein [Nordella sp. HKS 07]QIG46871.1 hypothetical protein G5V57_03385 [Nordella sp. HKS 07]
MPKSEGALPYWARAIVTILIAAIVGPLIGTALMFFLSGVPGGLLPEGIVAEVKGSPVIFGVFLGYVVGGIQALVCGVVFAAYGWSSGRLPAKVALMAAVPLALIFNFIFFGMTLGGIVSSMIIHVVPAFAVWWLVKAYWQKAEA